MRQETINKILTSGSGRERIRLYFTDIAIFSVYAFSGDIDEKEEEAPSLLTQAQRDDIFNSITDPRDVKYYRELRNYNKAFLLFKPTVNNLANNFKYIKSEISKYTVYKGLTMAYEDLINEMLDTVKDEENRAELLGIALNSLSPIKAKHFKSNTNRSLIGFAEDSIPETLYTLIQTLNTSIKDAKEFIEGIKLFLNRCLPIQPYKQYIKNHENKIKTHIKECEAMLEVYTSIEKTETILKRLKQDREKKKEYDYTINKWEEVEAIVTDEDLEDIKTAGL
jgi:hypothetical protein